MVGRVEKYLLEKIKSENSIHITLIDPEKVTASQASAVAAKAKLGGTSAIMIGGSTFTSTKHLDTVVKAVKRTAKLPVILFPNNVTGISRYADAIWFMSLLNSVDPYFLVGAQILGAPMVKKYRLEPIPMGYIIVGDGGTAGVVGKAVPIPYNKPELAAAHALAGQYLGMRFIYLEAGSGARKPVPSGMIRAVKSYIDVPLIVGGGIKTRKQALTAAAAGADIIVTGNIVENAEVKDKVSEIIKGIKSGRL
ncbi:geranylgeranylglyceryl/heptaprenylglyceryl phosphate synthase [Candidatus Bathyarchaeota archaeon]|nr:MAG: geranylgeranylglyceryl/heptaprenylglyceryl phosphate synthase [Candidatus Bathyarchaeota archaeon]RJS81610.1 MAG: geranylgeranylglyceryl/heptaprenylglyceryl phosphate synthase [Candidatus Bathyarchaeota archaeon]